MAQPYVAAGGSRSRRTFLYIDLVGFTATTDVHGDEVAANIAGCLSECVVRALGPDEELVKVLGDGVLLACPDAPAATALIDRVRANLTAHAQPLAVRIGVHSGEAISLDGDYIGAAVNLASRLTAAASPDQVVVSRQTATELAAAGIATRSIGSRRFRHVSDEVELFELVVGDGTPIERLDPVCHMRLERSSTVTRRWQDHDIGFCSEQCAAQFELAPDRYSSHLEEC